MIPVAIDLLQKLNDPRWITIISWVFVASYYIVSIFFIRHDHANYAGIWRKNGTIDTVSSVLILSLVDLVSRNELPLVFLLQYYLLLVFLFAFLFNILEWHWPGMLDGIGAGWKAEPEGQARAPHVSSASPRRSGKRYGRPTRLSGCTKNFAAA